MFDFTKLEEKITVEAYSEDWSKWFEEEKPNLEKVFGDNLVATKHYGSTAVPGLWAKPIVDILVGLKELVVSDKEKGGLKELGYEYFGQLHEEQLRHYARKRGQINYNLAIVQNPSDIWDIHILLRDYLRKHPNEVEAYSNIKKQALKEGKEYLLEYSTHKDQFVKELLKRAQTWTEIEKGRKNAK